MGGIVMKEDYVSYEVAKLLKEKWFPINEFLQNKIGDYKGIPVSKITKEMIEEKMLSCIPQSIVMKWLREVHNIHADIIIEGNSSCIKYYSNIRPFKIMYPTRFGDSIDTIKIGTYNTYEEAVKASIKYCLENLI